MYFEFLKRKKLRGFTAGLLAAAVLFSPVSFPQTALAADTDGLIYGTGTDSYMEDNPDSITIEAGNRKTSDGETAEAAAGAAVGIEGLVIETVTSSAKPGTAASFGISVSVGAGNTKPSQALLETVSASPAAGLIYGIRSTGFFGVQKAFLTIAGKIDTSSAASYGTDFNEAYSALEIYVYLRREGFSAAAACGILGNIKQESGFDPQAFDTEDGAFGLFQCVGLSKARLETECEDVTKGLQQARTMIEKIAPELFRKNSGAAAGISYEAYKLLTDPGEAAVIWRAVAGRQPEGTEDSSEYRTSAQSYYDRWAEYDGSGFDIIEEAMKYLGGKYVYGGDSLITGIDCSHYVCRILSITGHYDGGYRTSFDLRTLGTGIMSLAEAQPGDVLCWNGHVAFYITDGFYINAASTKKGICIGSGNIGTLLGGLITIRRVR